MKKTGVMLGLVFVVLVSLAGSAGAVSLEYYGIESGIKNDFTVHSIVTLVFKEPVSRLIYRLDSEIYNLDVSNNFGISDCEIVEKARGSDISCGFSGMSENKSQVRLEFDTKGGIRKVGEKYEFEADYTVSQPIERVFVIIKLPDRSFLGGPVANESYYPREGKTIVTKENKIAIYWEMANLRAGDEMRFTVLYEPSDLRGPIFNLLITALTIAVIVVMIGIAVYMRRGQAKAKPVRVVTPLLKDDEKKIVGVLNKHGGSALQKVLIRETDFSKAKISRLVKSLKERKVVDIEPVSGRENRIILKAGVEE